MQIILRIKPPSTYRQPITPHFPQYIIISTNGEHHSAFSLYRRRQVNMPSKKSNAATAPGARSAKKRKRSKAFRDRIKIRKVEISDDVVAENHEQSDLASEPSVEVSQDAPVDTSSTEKEAADSTGDGDTPHTDVAEVADDPVDEAQDAASAKSVAELEAELKRHGVRAANVLLELVARVKPGRNDSVRAMHASRRSLATLASATKSDHTLAEWVNERRSDLHAALAAMVGSDESSNAEADSALAICALAGSSAWAAGVNAALLAKKEHPSSLLGECFAAPFLGLRMTVLHEIASRNDIPATRALALLQHCVQPPKKMSVRETKAPNKTTLSELSAAYGAAWLRVLGGDLSNEQLADALQRIPVDVLPHVSEPLAFADLLTRCYNDGVNSDIAISALDGLFLLISKHRLDYPLFYQKLYALFTPEVLFHSSQNARFLDLASKFLRFGEFLPGIIIAAFIKRLARRALVAPPAGAMWCLRLALDLLYKHPNVSFLVHRTISLFENSASKEKKAPAKSKLPYKGADPFDDEELDPQASRADESCLWELEPLKAHISPAVSRLVLVFSKDVRKKPPPPQGDVSDYASLTFADVFEAEFKRRSKTTTLAYDAPGNAPGVKEVIEDLGTAILWR